MSHYRKIDVRIWNDAKFNSLDPTGKLAFFMLLTHPMMTAIGAMRGSASGLADEMGFRTDAKRDAFLHAFRDIIAKGMAEYDEDASLIALPNFVRYNPPTSINMIKAWESCLEFLPECGLKTLSIQRAVAYAHGMGKAFKDAIPLTMRFPKSREQRTENRDKQPISQPRDCSFKGTHSRENPLVDDDGVIDDSGNYDHWDNEEVEA